MIALAGLAALLAWGSALARAHSGGGPAAVAATEVSGRVGPGTVLMRLRRPGPGGPIEAYVLRVDLADHRVRAGLLYPGRIAAVESVSTMALRAGAFAAVNGDFFNIGKSGAPIGPVVGGGELLKGPEQDRQLAAGVGVDGVGRIAPVWLSGSVLLPGDRRLALSDLNDAAVGPEPILEQDGIEGAALFTPQWGTYPLGGAVDGLHSVTEVLVRRGRVVRVRHRTSAGPIAHGTYVLLGAGSVGRALARLRVGQAVSVTYGQATSAAAPFRFALGGKYLLLRNGVVQRGIPGGAPTPRTGMGFANRGHVMYLVVTAGPQPGVPGIDLPELARFMRTLGVTNAIDLDDGGSTTIVAQPRKHAALTLLNDPADGSERPVANGVALFSVRVRPDLPSPKGGPSR